ncbi:hypothetical protein F2P81_023241 [Scophthalmus maximus]|uniref:Secreted protein n=1 Tax=Scophthalmus maximus TaxID=52904 RepID=A0A6A4RVX3_SCOMX|nr:hypothetical protein F2P81_023241 [Scophthalmus maximus]
MSIMRFPHKQQRIRHLSLLPALVFCLTSVADSSSCCCRGYIEKWMYPDCGSGVGSSHGPAVDNTFSKMHLIEYSVLSVCIVYIETTYSDVTILASDLRIQRAAETTGADLKCGRCHYVARPWWSVCLCGERESRSHKCPFLSSGIQKMDELEDSTF